VTRKRKNDKNLNQENAVAKIPDTINRRGWHGEGLALEWDKGA